MEVLFRDAVVAAQMALGLVSKILNAVDVVAGFSKALRMVNAHMMEVRDIQHALGAEAVGIDDTIGPDFALHNRH